MNQELHKKAEDLFLSAADLPKQERGEYLDRMCGDSPELRATVEGMLRVEGEDGEFLARSPFGAGSASAAQRTRIQKLVEQSNAGGRLFVEEEVARGGMGTIYRVRDTDMRRTLAMKVIRGQKGASSTGEVPGVPQEFVDRFLSEAVVTGQLEHPGVVPVHELGVDSSGRLYFTMPLVGGRTLAEVLDLVHDDSSEWNRTRALGVIQKVCDTMAYAHDAGVIHRDLKPANVMVGEYGEVYVMDWGLARIQGTEPNAPQTTDDESAEVEDPEVTRCLEEDSAFITRQGAILGTPFYMSPEQARGEGNRVGAAADIYAVGSLLYHLFAGRAPYASSKDKTDTDQVLADLRRGPPPSIQTVAHALSPELASICEKAMAREPEDRYVDMAALSRDLQAYLEGRVVRAHRTGAWVELKKWILRNRTVAAAAGFAFVVVLLGAFGVAAAERRSADLSRSFLIFYLEQEEKTLWPAIPDKVPAMQAWLDDANEMGDRIETAIDGLTGEPGVLENRRAQMRLSLERIDQLRESVEERIESARNIEVLSITSPEARAAWQEAIAAIDASELYQRAAEPFHLEPQIGLFPLGENPETGLWEFWHLQSGECPELNGNWWYDGHGDEQNRWVLIEDSEGNEAPLEGTGLIFVLVPPCDEFRFGGQGLDKTGPNYEPVMGRNLAAENEFRRQAGREPRTKQPRMLAQKVIPMEPFFISKYELTQGQWQRCFGSNPSIRSPRMPRNGPRQDNNNRVTWIHPVHFVDGEEASVLLGHLQLRIPREEEWEYATRADTEDTWWFGNSAEDLLGVGNVLGGDDAMWVARAQDFLGSPLVDDGYDVQIDDGYTGPSPVGVFRANPFGLHDVYGNVREVTTPRAAFLESPRAKREKFAISFGKGGSFSSPTSGATSGHGIARPFIDRQEDVGLRPVRAIDPASE